MLRRVDSRADFSKAKRDNTPLWDVGPDARAGVDGLGWRGMTVMKLEEEPSSTGDDCLVVEEPPVIALSSSMRENPRASSSCSATPDVYGAVLTRACRCQARAADSSLPMVLAMVIDSTVRRCCR